MRLALTKVWVQFDYNRAGRRNGAIAITRLEMGDGGQAQRQSNFAPSVLIVTPFYCSLFILLFVPPMRVSSWVYFLIRAAIATRVTTPRCSSAIIAVVSHSFL